MQITSLTERQLKKLPRLSLSSKIINTEAKLYVSDKKQRYLRVNELLKIFYVQSTDYLSDKIYIIGKIMSLFENIEMPEFVLPTSLVAINGKVSGYSMPWIEDNINLSLLLNNPKVKIAEKIKYLRKILQILIKINNNPELRDKIFLGDIHEANFLFDITDQVVRVVDLDSAYIPGGPIPTSKFTTFNEKLYGIPEKYPIDLETDKVIPNDQNTNLCFLYMLLNSLSGENAYKWSFEEHYEYISKLKRIGFPANLLDMLSNIYTSCRLDIYDPELLNGINVNRDYRRILTK